MKPDEHPTPEQLREVRVVNFHSKAQYITLLDEGCHSLTGKGGERFKIICEDALVITGLVIPLLEALTDKRFVQTKNPSDGTLQWAAEDHLFARASQAAGGE